MKILNIEELIRDDFVRPLVEVGFRPMKHRGRRVTRQRNKRGYLILAAMMCLGNFGKVVAAGGETQDLPNLVFILADDQRYDTLGCAGHPVVQTPNLDRLAGEGVRFSNMFVTTSICMASRASIFTGLTETTHGYTGGPAPARPLRREDVDTSFPTLLRQAGYRTGFFGKQHVRFEEGDQTAMNRMFDEYELIWRNPYFKIMADGSRRHTAELIGDHSEAFLEALPAGQPFLLHMSFNLAHAEDGDKRPGIGHFPWPQEEDGLYEDLDSAPPRLGDQRYFDVLPWFMKASLNRERWYWRWDTPEKYAVNMRAYFRMITAMDRIIGRVLERLEALNLHENTVILYTADNGFYMGDRGLAGKWSHFEESLRVPLIIYDPRPSANCKGEVETSLAVNLDLAPTLLELAGLQMPEKYQGRSLVRLLRGEDTKDWRTSFYCEHHMNHEGIPKWRGVRGERFTYAHYYEQGENGYEFLHDLHRDPTQYQNLAGLPEFREVLESMRRKLTHYQVRYSR